MGFQDRPGAQGRGARRRLCLKRAHTRTRWWWREWGVRGTRGARALQHRHPQTEAGLTWALGLFGGDFPSGPSPPSSCLRLGLGSG